MRQVLLVIVIILSAFICTSCRSSRVMLSADDSREVIASVKVTETHDTLIIRDSVSVMILGDTVRETRIKTIYQTAFINLVDTFHDTIQVRSVVEKEKIIKPSSMPFIVSLALVIGLFSLYIFILSRRR